MEFLELHPDLVATIALLDAAGSPRVTSRRVRWDGMSRVLEILRGPLAESEANPLADREVSVVRMGWAWARACMDGPVPPAHECTGYPQLMAELDIAISVLGAQRLQRLKAALQQVASTPHPAQALVAELVQSGPSGSADRRGTVLIVRGEGLRGVTSWVEEAAVDADVARVSQAKERSPWHAAIIFGPPERYTSSAWLTGPQAAAHAGWLVTAPPAAQVTVISWTGHRPLGKSAYQPWKDAPGQSIVEGETVEVYEQDFLPDNLDDFRPVAAPTFKVEDDSVDAFGLQFRAHSETILAYFSKDVGPRPQVVTFEDSHAVISGRPLKSIVEGRCLMFRTSVAGKDALDVATSKWLAKHKKGFPTEEANRIRQQLKDAVRSVRSQIGSKDLVTRLVAQGLDQAYATSLPNRVLHPDFIAPQSADRFIRVCRALSLGALPGAYGLLNTLRTARRRAGADLVAQIAERLDDIADIPDRLRDEGFVTLTEMGLEGVVLLVVRRVMADAVVIPAWRLGQAMTQEGHAWHP